MTTITEDYVSFETAKLLQEKGFDANTLRVYSQNGNFMPNGAIEDTYQIFYAAPTLQMVIKWLKEVYKIYIAISPVSGKGYSAILCDVGDFDNFNYIGETDYFFHPEEAVEAGIKYALENLI